MLDLHSSRTDAHTVADLRGKRIYNIARGALGFGLSLAGGLVFGVAAGASSAIRSGVAPVLTVLRATPVMSIILLALIWFRTEWVPVFVAFLMVFPIVCGNVIEGVRNVEANLLRFPPSWPP